MLARFDRPPEVAVELNVLEKPQREQFMGRSCYGSILAAVVLGDLAFAPDLGANSEIHGK
jgi:hypothetical protein